MGSPGGRWGVPTLEEGTRTRARWKGAEGRRPTPSPPTPPPPALSPRERRSSPTTALAYMKLRLGFRVSRFLLSRSFYRFCSNFCCGLKISCFLTFYFYLLFLLFGSHFFNGFKIASTGDLFTGSLLLYDTMVERIIGSLSSSLLDRCCNLLCFIICTWVSSFSTSCNSLVVIFFFFF